jgi:hypothetical protein
LGLPCVRHCPTHGNHLRHCTPFVQCSGVHTLRYDPGTQLSNVICGTDLRCRGRQCPQTADLSFYYFSTPPHSARRFICVCRVVPVRSLCRDLPWNVIPRSGHACRGPRVVLRGFVVLPLFAQGQHYVFYLSCTTGGGGSVSLITVSARLRIVFSRSREPHP